MDHIQNDIHSKAVSGRHGTDYNCIYHKNAETLEFMVAKLFSWDYNELVDICSFEMCMLKMTMDEYPECQVDHIIYKKISQVCSLWSTIPSSSEVVYRTVTNFHALVLSVGLKTNCYIVSE
jgi:hypothetical protein